MARYLQLVPGLQGTGTGPLWRASWRTKPLLLHEVLPASCSRGNASVAQMQTGLRGAVAAVTFKALRTVFPCRSSTENAESEKLVCVISQNGSKPLLHLGHRHVLPLSIILNLQRIESSFSDQSDKNFRTEVSTGFAQRH